MQGFFFKIKTFGVRQWMLIIALHFFALLLPALLFAQENAEDDSEIPAFSETEYTFDPVRVRGGLKDAVIAIEVTRWGAMPDGEEDTTQSFEVSIAGQPSFLQNVHFGEGNRLEFSGDEFKKTLNLRFDAMERGAVAEKEDLVIAIKSNNDSVIPQERLLILPMSFRPLASGDVSLCVQLPDLDKDPEFGVAHQFCQDQPDTFTVYDDLWLFFTPQRDLRQVFRWQLVHESGEKILSGVHDPNKEEFSTLHKAGDGAPAKFAAHIGDLRGRFFLRLKDGALPDAAGHSDGSGQYTIQSCEPKADQAVFGQSSGWSSQCIDDWQDEGSFELQTAQLHFQGFGVESGSLPFRKNGRFSVKKIENDASAGNSVELSLEADWEEFFTTSDEGIAPFTGIIRAEDVQGNSSGQRGSGQVTTIRGDTLWLYDGPTCPACRVPKVKIGPETIWDPDGDYTSLAAVGAAFEANKAVVVKKVKRASSKVMLEFPELLDPSREITDSITVEMNAVESGLLFWAEMFSLLPTDAVPPLRELIESQYEPEYYWGVLHPPDFDGESTSSGRRGSPNGLIKGESVQKKFHIHLSSYDVVAGQPKAPFNRHIRNTNLKWYLPLWIGADQQIKLAGFAVYAAEPGVYDGPWPKAPGSEDDEESASGVDGNEGDQSGTEGGGEDSGRTGAEEGTGSGGGDVDGGEAGTDRGQGPDSETADGNIFDPNNVNPAHPEVAGKITEWIGVARPPEDAVIGANLRYSGRGNIVGTVPGGIISSEHESGAIDPVYLWENKKALDSIDHCTLEEYVLASLSGEGIRQCKGRYGAVRDLKGEQLSTAKSAVEGAGFAYTLAPGSPAQSPEAVGTIEKQEPAASQYLQQGETVTLFIHSPYVPGVSELPDFVGKPLKEAKDWLERHNFAIQLRPGSAAPSPERSGTVQEQEPAAKTKVASDVPVTLKVYANYVQGSKVPDVTGLPVGQAKARISAAGLKAALKPGRAPGYEHQAGLVERQEPLAGAETLPGTEVAIFVYAPYVQMAEVPDVTNLTFQEASSRLAGAGLVLEWREGGTPPGRNQAARAMRQEPKAGTQVANGQKISVWFYGQYVPSRDELVADYDCSRLPGSQAYWDNAANAPRCGCFRGLRWNLAQNQCVTESVFNDDVCNRDYPGSIATGRQANGSLNCDCPQGLVWNSNATRCVPQVAGQNNRDSRGRDWQEQCDYKIWQIKMFMQTYNYDRRNNRLQKQMADDAAREAANMGCNQTEIDAAQGKASGTGSGSGTQTGSGAGSGSGGYDECPCVDENGRRYRVSFGQDCGMEGADSMFKRDYNCN